MPDPGDTFAVLFAVNSSANHQRSSYHWSSDNRDRQRGVAVKIEKR